MNPWYYNNLVYLDTYIYISSQQIALIVNCNVQYTVKLVSRGHLWDKEKVAL